MAQTEDARDATRRTRLANERTYLAWWRTGLTSFAVSFGAGRLVPELTGGTAWPYEAIGFAFAAVGIGFITQEFVRQKQVDEALDRGECVPLHERTALAFATVGVLLGLATIVLVVGGQT